MSAAGYGNDFYVGEFLPDCHEHGDALLPGHNDIRDDEVYGMPAKTGNALIAVISFMDFIFRFSYNFV